MAHPSLRRLRTRSARPAFVAWLVVALCFAQWIGFLHGIAHAGFEPSGRIVAPTSTDVASASIGAGGDDLAFAVRHSCAAFDAATLGAAAPSVPVSDVPSCEAVASLVPSTSGPVLPDARLAYRSRAPPAITLA